MQNTRPGQLKDIGGQAVIEGVMMRAPTSLVIAVRKPDHEIVVRREKLTPLKERFRPFRWPVLRGIAVLAESLIWGMKALTYSANQAVETDAGDSPKEMGGVTMAITILASAVLGIGLTYLAIVVSRIEGHRKKVRLGYESLGLA